MRKLLAKESTGTAIGVLIIGWFAFESIVLGGDNVRSSPVHEVGTPLQFEVPRAGETYGITIDRGETTPPGGVRRGRGTRGDKRLQWRILDPNGEVVLTDSDPYRRSTRLVRFTPQSTGQHTLIVEWDNSGFFKRHGVGYVTLLINRNDRSLLRRWLPWVW